MDGVEKEFETRDAHIASLEARNDTSAAKIMYLEADLEAAREVVESQKVEIQRINESRNGLLQKYQEAEFESRELQEFLQAEKYTLSGKK